MAAHTFAPAYRASVARPGKGWRPGRYQRSASTPRELRRSLDGRCSICRRRMLGHRPLETEGQGQTPRHRMNAAGSSSGFQDPANSAPPSGTSSKGGTSAGGGLMGWLKLFWQDCVTLLKGFQYPKLSKAVVTALLVLVGIVVWPVLQHALDCFYIWLLVKTGRTVL